MMMMTLLMTITMVMTMMTTMVMQSAESWHGADVIKHLAFNQPPPAGTP